MTMAVATGRRDQGIQLMAPLPLITALARAGALDRAWYLFRQGGYANDATDPAALAVKGRLLKDSGLRVSGEARCQLLAEAAQAYAAAQAIDPRTWLAINVATLRLLSGDESKAAEAAQQVLMQLNASQPMVETPYWLAATRAEALLILGDLAAAEMALADARLASPDNYADQASTVRQLSLILAAKELDKNWIDPHRPPPCLYYAGHLSVAEDSPELASKIAVWLAAQNIGAGFGALAAGADILIAEALLAKRAELHVVLPVPKAEFVTQSVKPYGDGWVSRFEACLSNASSLRETSRVSGPYEPLATSLAADMAMGHTALQAWQWETSALQLLVLDEGVSPLGMGVATARDGAVWQASGRVQHLMRWPRETGVAASADKQEGRADRLLSALVLVRITGLEQLDEGTFAQQLDLWLADWWRDLHAYHALPAVQPGLGNDRIFAFATPAQALEFINFARTLQAAQDFPATFSGHYALLHHTDLGLAGPGLIHLSALADAALPGTVVLSDALASVLALFVDGLAMEPMGEVDGKSMFALT